MSSMPLFKMSAFSRGCIGRYRNAFNKISGSGTSHSCAPRAVQQPRFFSSAFRLSGPSTANKGRKAIPKESNISRLLPTIPKKNADSIAQPLHQSYAATIAQKGQPVLLYKAPSHTLFLISCYGGSIFCFTYAAYNFNSHYFNADPGVAQWVKYSFAGICFLMASFGGWLVLGPVRIIKTITAVPQKALAPRGQPGLKLEVELRKMFPIPFLPARKFQVSPDEIKLPSAFSGITKMSAAELQATRAAERKQINDAKEYDQKHYLTRPFRRMQRGPGEMFRALRQAWTREGFKITRIKDQKYQLDVSRGWVLDGGRPLERLARVERRLPEV